MGYGRYMGSSFACTALTGLKSDTLTTVGDGSSFTCVYPQEEENTEEEETAQTEGNKRSRSSACFT